MSQSINTPWGESQSIHNCAEGVDFVSTAGHGGFRVTKDFMLKNFSEAALNFREMYPDFYHDYGNVVFWEEDCMAAVVIWELRNKVKLTTPEGLVEAEKILQMFYPEYWEKVKG